MKILLFLILILNLVDAKMHVYSLKTKSEFLLEFPSKKLKKLNLYGTYGLGVNDLSHKFDFRGYIFKNRDFRINISNLKVFAAKSEKIYKIKIKKYLAVTEVNLDNKLIGKIKWTNLDELNNGLNSLSTNTPKP